MTEEQIRIDQTKKIFDILAEVINSDEGCCSYRYLIYDKLGIPAQYYEDLLSGMVITNALVDREEVNGIIHEIRKFIDNYEYYIYPMENFGKEKYILKEDIVGKKLLKILDGKEDTNEE